VTLAALAEARALARAIAAENRGHLLAMTGAFVTLDVPAGDCPLCGGPMLVEKTVLRTGRTMDLGSFTARETVTVCAARCRHPSGQLVTGRAEALARRLPPGDVVGYDLMVHVGLARFLGHRQREEIRADLERETGLSISTGEVSELSRRFLCYLTALHEERSPALAAALREDGGWPLHLDATGEDGRGTLLVILAGWRQWVLGAWKIPTECAEAVLPHLLEAAEQFGNPCAVMRDLGRAMIAAVAEFVAARKITIPVLSCHEHFLADIGGDLLESGHDGLAEVFRRAGLRSALRKLARDIGKRLGPEIGAARRAILRWQEERDAGHRLPGGSEGLAVVRSLAQWVLDYPADSTYRSFPFDRPWLDLYDRVLTGRRAADAFRRGPPEDKTVEAALSRFCRALDPVVTDESCARTAAALRRRAALFDELRGILRLFPKNTSDGEARRSSERRLTPEEAQEELRDVRQDLDRWRAALVDRRPARGPAGDLREAVDEILAHLDRHQHSLWGHAVVLPPEAGGGIRLVDRTNNLEEAFFHRMKHGERRRSGRKILTHDFENLPAEAALAENLRHPDYVSILCGSLDELPAAFARLDAQQRDAVRAGLPEVPVRRRAAPDRTESASLPAPDRNIVRTEAMDRRIREAARSRAPHSNHMVG